MNGGDASELLGGLALFADLSQPQLEAVNHTFEEQTFEAGERILRQGFRGANFYVIVEGEAAFSIDGQERRRLARGDFFGEISALLGEPPTGDVVAVTSLRCLALASRELNHFLIDYPHVAYRLLQAEARRLKTSDPWRE